MLGAPLSLQEIPANALLVVDADSLIHYCKQLGSMLYAPNGSFPGGEYLTLARNKFHYLKRMQAQSDGNAGIGPSYHFPFLVSESVLEELNGHMKEDRSDARRISSWPIERTFVYLDVSDFSKEPPGREALIVNSIVGVVNAASIFGHPDLRTLTCNKLSRAMILHWRRVYLRVP